MQTERTTKERPNKLAYNVNEACHTLGIGRTLIYRLISEGKIIPVKIAGRVLIPEAEVRKMLTGELAGA